MPQNGEKPVPKQQSRLQVVQNRPGATPRDRMDLPLHLAACALAGALSACTTPPGQDKAGNPYSLIELPARSATPIPLAPSEPIKSSTITPPTPKPAR